MAFTKKTVSRIDDLSGDSFILMEAPTASSEYAQGVVLIDEAGNPQGLAASPLIVSSNVGTVVNFHSGGTDVTSMLVQATSGSLRQVRIVLNPSVSSARYLMLFNATALPVADGTTPLWVMFVPAGGEASESFPDGLDYSAGLVASISTTHNTLAIVTGVEGVIFGQRV